VNERTNRWPCRKPV